MATRKIAQIPNFTPTNDQIYVRDPSTVVPNSPDDPDMILIFGWGDGLPRHVSKYAEGYATLYPAARQIIILGPISKFFFASLARRVTDMAPVVEALKDLVNPTATKESKIMIQAMSNSGGSNYASMLQAYRDKYAKPLPHQLVIFDSTPGNPEWSWGRMLQWSRAMSMGMAKYFPWPEFFTRGLMSITIMVMYLIGFLTRQEPAGVFAARVMDDPSYLSTETKKLYLYSKEDDMISHKDIEMYEARARTKGYQTEAVLFDGSPHVGHMRQHPEKYWGSIQKAWLNALQKQ